jgi:hypothetical protein
VTVLKGANPLRQVVVTLPRDIRVGSTRKGLSVSGAGFRLSKRRVRLSRDGKLLLRLPSGGASRVTAKLGGRAIHASKRLMRELERHRSVRLTITVRTVDAHPRRSAFHVKFSARR